VSPALGAASLAATGRYVIRHAGQDLGEERWSIEPMADGGAVARGEQSLAAPHPVAGDWTWRAELDPQGRIATLEIDWRVGTHGVRAEHTRRGSRWHARVLYGGHAREQEGDFPPQAEVVLGSHALLTCTLRRYVLEPGADHVFPALVIGPPFFAAEPGRQRLVCTAAAERDTPFGRVAARRIELGDPPGVAPPFAAWIDAHDVVLESFEDTHTDEPWMRLVEYSRA
jgi:hypothetical protein